MRKVDQMPIVASAFNFGMQTPWEPCPIIVLQKGRPIQKRDDFKLEDEPNQLTVDWLHKEVSSFK